MFRQVELISEEVSTQLTLDPVPIVLGVVVGFQGVADLARRLVVAEQALKIRTLVLENKFRVQVLHVGDLDFFQL